MNALIKMCARNCDVTMVVQYLFGWYGRGGKC